MKRDMPLGKGAVEYRNVSLSYPLEGDTVEAVRDVSLKVDPGKFFVLVGPSGCGKSSLLTMLTGLIGPTQGEVSIDGARVMGPDPDRAGMVFQEPNLLPWLSARRNIEFPLQLKNVDKAERRKKSDALLDLVGLAEFGEHFPYQLSGGMKQRISIARGLIQEPSVLLMDEPFSALDEQTRIDMGMELLRIWHAASRTILFVTHSLMEAVFLADTIGVMGVHPGRILQCIDVPLPRPRTVDMIDTPEFSRIRSQIWELIRR